MWAALEQSWRISFTLGVKTKSKAPVGETGAQQQTYKLLISTGQCAAISTRFPPESKQRMDEESAKRFNFRLTKGKTVENRGVINGSWGKQGLFLRNWLKMRHGP
jgi:hypothetical protein